MPKLSYASLGVAVIAAALALAALLVTLNQPDYTQVAQGVAYRVVNENIPDPGLSADEVEAIAGQAAQQATQSALEDAGLTGDALDARMEDAIIAFIKSRAKEDGQASATPPSSQAKNIDVAAIDPATEPVAGNADARYQLIVYSDYECPFCKRFWPTLQTVIDDYGDGLAVTLRDFPLPFHGEAAKREAVAAACAFKLGGDDAFWAYSDHVYSKTSGNGQGISGNKPLATIAKSVGLDGQAFADCLNNPGNLKAGIQADMQSGRSAGVRGTPTSVLVDTQTGQTAVIRGAQPLSVMTSALDALLNRTDAS